MSIRNEAFKTFNDILDWELRELFEEEKIYSQYNDGFEMSSRVSAFNPKIRKDLFFIVFNERLLAFLSCKIDNYIKPHANTGVEIFGQSIENNESLDSISDKDESWEEGDASKRHSKWSSMYRLITSGRDAKEDSQSSHNQNYNSQKKQPKGGHELLKRIATRKDIGNFLTGNSESSESEDEDEEEKKKIEEARKQKQEKRAMKDLKHKFVEKLKKIDGLKKISTVKSDKLRSMFAKSKSNITSLVMVQTSAGMIEKDMSLLGLLNFKRTREVLREHKMKEVVNRGNYYYKKKLLQNIRLFKDQYTKFLTPNVRK